MNKFSPTLTDYENFAEEIGLKLEHTKGLKILKYVNKDGSSLMPFELGNIYRFSHLKYSEGIKDSLNYLKFYVEKAKTREELIEGINNYIKELNSIITAEEEKYKVK